MCGFQYNHIVGQIKKMQYDPTVIPVNTTPQGDESDDNNMDTNDDVLSKSICYYLSIISMNALCNTVTVIVEHCLAI